MNLAKKLIQPATLADLDKLPSTWRGEIIDGTLYAFPRPSFLHADLETAVATDLRGPFHRGRGGPGGWWIVCEPGIRVARSPEFSPDVAGWRRDRMPRSPRPNEPTTIVPDWVCEILSPSTRSYDLIVKRRFYAEIGVAHLWYIDPAARSVTVSRLEDGKWMELRVHGPDETVRAEPFDAIEIDFSAWWEGLDEEHDEDSSEP